jgi:hypothetical protein
MNQNGDYYSDGVLSFRPKTTPMNNQPEMSFSFQRQKIGGKTNTRGFNIQPNNTGYSDIGIERLITSSSQ